MLSGHSFFEKKATGWSLGMFLNLFDEIAPTPVSEASTSTMTGLEGSGLRMGAMVNTVWSCGRAGLAAGFQTRHLGSRDVKECAMELNLWMKH